MAEEKFDKLKVAKFWLDSAEEDFQTMLLMHDTKRFTGALFVGHLVIEKLAKAVYVDKIEDYPPLIHDLRRILEKSGIELEDDRKVILDSITTFNIKARYDDYKQNFYALCTEDFTKEWVEKIKECRLWIKSML